jgi:hypothetical protein
MQELHLPNMILCFDGRVIELFQHAARGGSVRYHIAQFQGGEVTEGRKDARLSLVFSTGRVLSPFPGDRVEDVRGFLDLLSSPR